MSAMKLLFVVAIPLSCFGLGFSPDVDSGSPPRQALLLGSSTDFLLLSTPQGLPIAPSPRIRPCQLLLVRNQGEPKVETEGLLACTVSISSSTLLLVVL